jgi:hypothetical protein
MFAGSSLFSSDSRSKNYEPLQEMITGTPYTDLTGQLTGEKHSPPDR